MNYVGSRFIFGIMADCEVREGDELAIAVCSRETCRVRVIFASVYIYRQPLGSCIG